MKSSHDASAPARRSAARRLALLAARRSRASRAQSLAEGQELRAPQERRSRSRRGKKIEVIEFFSLRLPALRASSSRSCSPGSSKLPADVQFRRVPVDVPAALGRTSARSTTRSRRWARSRSSRPRCSSRSTARSMHALATTRRSSTGRRRKGLDRKKVEDIVQLVRDRRQGEPREAARADVQHPVGADGRSSTASSSHRVRARCGTHAQHAGGDRRS